MEKRYVFYVLIIIVCIIALCVGVYAQLFYENSDDKLMIGMSNISIQAQNSTEEEKRKTEFNNLFENKLVYLSNNINNKATRIVMGKDLIYTNNQVSKVEKDKYEVNINIPIVNINSNVAKQINEQIEQIFLQKAATILSNNIEMYTIYSVDYIGYVNNNILSLVIKSNLKEGENPQRVIFMTYNYNLDTGKTVSLDELLSQKKITVANLQNKINKEIKEISKKTEDLKNIGYSVYTRNPDDNMYKVENTTLYFLGEDNYIYILYAYGNSNNTSEVDVIVT